MVSLRFPFLYSQSPNPNPPHATTSRSFSATATASCSVAVACGAGIAAGIALSQTPTNPLFGNAFNSLLSNLLLSRNRFSPMWGSLSLSDTSAPVTESKTGMSFPSVLKDSQRLLGIGLRKKAILGLKNIDVYAFGVYADDADIKKLLSEKYATLSTEELKERKELKEDLMESDISMTVRLQIVYGRLSIRSVRNAFEESVGSRLRKFGGSDNKELLERFTSQFKDDYKIPRGSIIDLSRDQGYVLRTTIDGKEVGSIQSKLLCRSIFDLYIGDEPFDQKAKEDVQQNLAFILQK
ncbi:hypothetical protein ACH5RR_020168 [Cinchona calisaya]|uniref:Chalcone isomerase domain-containing protein n=1 Tax=Cinchona calisaya TaxID=153742 RepID=A0ABD2ZEQ6_9GENT